MYPMVCWAMFSYVIGPSMSGVRPWPNRSGTWTRWWEASAGACASHVSAVHIPP